MEATVEVPTSKEGSLSGSTNFGRKSKQRWSSSGVDSPDFIRAEKGFRMDLRKRTSRQGKTKQTKPRRDVATKGRGKEGGANMG